MKARQRLTPHRQLLILTGNEYENICLAEQCVSDYKNTLWIGNRHKGYASAHFKDYKRHLGTSLECIVYNAFQGFRPNSISALEGCLQRFGVFIIITPDFKHWAQYEAKQKSISFSYLASHKQSLFINYFIDKCERNPSVAIVAEQNARLPIEAVDSASSLTSQTAQLLNKNEFSLSHDQQSLFNDIARRIIDLDCFSAIITSKRGRGKSTLLGALAANWIIQNKKVMVCASNKSHVFQLYSTIQNLLSSEELPLPLFIPPDGLIPINASDDTIMIVDEAANIPNHLFIFIQSKFKHFICATTEIGYEGTGLGFVHKVKPLLNSNETVKAYELSTPIRWYENDPLESLFYDVFYPSYTTPCTNMNNETVISFIEKSQKNLPSLNVCFALLREAHYQTTQDDLMRMLDSDDHRIVKLEIGGQLIACAIVIQEHLLVTEELANKIRLGERRTSGNLIVQGLANILLSSDILTSSSWRINRIAVIPKYQKQGLGRSMVKWLLKEAQNENIDFLSTSFGLEPGLMTFWEKCELQLYKIGIKVDASSGLQSALMLNVLNPSFEKYTKELYLHFCIQLHYLKFIEKLPTFIDEREIKIRFEETLYNLAIKRLFELLPYPKLIKNNLAYVYYLSSYKADTSLLKLLKEILEKGNSKSKKENLIGKIHWKLYEHCNKKGSK